MTPFPQTFTATLAQAGMTLPDDALKLLDTYVALVAEANPTCSLVSQGDTADLWGRHIIDSLSLVPVLQRTGPVDGLLLDIGSGGGFPAIPLRVALPELRTVLLERSERKIGFLRRVVAALHLDNVDILLGEFPRAAQTVKPDWITARAVEKPSKMARLILDALPAGTTFLCQSAQGTLWDQKTFHVEPIEDKWTHLGLRRGPLELIRRLP